MIVRHALLYSGVKVIPAVATVITLVAFTRLMSPSQFGEYTLTITASTTAVAILANFLIIGLGRFEPAAEKPSEKKQLHSTVLLFAIIISVTLISVTFILDWFELLPDLSINYYLFAAIFQFLLILSLSQKLINANLLPLRYGVSLALKNLLVVAFGVVAISMGYGVDAILIGFALAALIASIPAYKLWEQTSFSFFNATILRKIWSYGAPLTFLYLFVSVINFSDRLFIDVMLGSKAVGLYSAGHTLTQSTIGIVGSVMHLSSFPLIVKAYEKQGLAEAQNLLARSFQLLILLMVPTTLGFLAIRSEISTIFLGKDYSSTAMVLMPVLAFSAFFGIIKSYYFDYTFQLVKATWLQSVPPFASAVINCILNYILIKEYGIAGAAYATLVSFVCFLIFTAYLSSKIFSLPKFPVPYVTKVLVAGMAMYFVVSLIDSHHNAWVLLGSKLFVGVLSFTVFGLFLLREELRELIKSY